MELETKAIHEGWKPGNGEPRQLPIYESTTFKYDSSEEMGMLFDLEKDGYFYSRLQNPTNDAVAAKLTSMEGGYAGMLTSSGQAANFFAIFNICEAGGHVVASGNIYGGSYNLLSVTMKKMGVDVTFINQDASVEEINAAFKENTKCMFGETLSNPTMEVLDIEKFASIAHAHGVPLIVDNTFATPANCQPIKWGADIVTHSTSKYMDGHAVALGGVIVDSGNFNWANGKFPEFTEPDESYHGVVYTEAFGKAAFITKARVQMMRDLGCAPAPMNCFLLNLGLETLCLRVERHSENAQKVAEYLESNPKIEWVNYPGLKDNKYHELAKKYLPKGCSGVISFGPKGGREGAAKFMNSLKLANIVCHVADARTGVLHPATSTHRQLSDQQLIDCGVTPDLIRMSVGIENADDIIADIQQALDQI